MTVEDDLKAETVKWLERIDDKRQKITLVDETRKDFLKNLDAYISDSRHFLEKGDLVRSFEAVIWAWSLLELGLREKFLTG